MIRFFEYKSCSTCQKARKFLESRHIQFESIPIVENPPSLAELKEMLRYIEQEGGSFKNLFNTSGVQYRELKISDKMKSGLTVAEALSLLAKNGKLIKRPFVLSKKFGVVGFNPEKWASLFPAVD